MRLLGLSPSILAVGSALVAANYAVIRFAVDLPEFDENDLIQALVAGVFPMSSLLLVGLAREALGRIRDGAWRPARVGFLVAGAVSVAVYSLHAYIVCGSGGHYSADYEAALDAALRRWGLTRGPGDPSEHPLRYGIVVTSLVALLGAPHLFFALLGGWLAEQVAFRGTSADSATPCLESPAP